MNNNYIYILYSCNEWKNRPMYIKLATNLSEKLFLAVRCLISVGKMDFCGREREKALHEYDDWKMRYVIDSASPTHENVNDLNSRLEYGLVEIYDDGVMVA